MGETEIAAPRSGGVSIECWLRLCLVVCMAAAALDYAVWSIHWPLMMDSSVMHYVVFLIQHGFKPYSQISDMNMPGAYLTEDVAMHVFGAGDLAWRLYEFFLLAVLTVSLVVITRRRDWVAGIYAGGVFLALHAAEGPRQASQRDEVIAVLLMVGFAALFTAVRSRVAWLTALFGVADSFAISIKPTFLPLLVALFALLVVVLRRRRIPVSAYVAWTAAGVAMVLVLNLGFLLKFGVMKEFLYVVRMVVPAYHGGAGKPLFVAARTVPKYILPLLPLVAVCAVGNWRCGSRWDWERVALALGVECGLLSYFAQGKGFPNHRYEYLVCLLAIVGMETFEAMRGDGWLRWIAEAVVVLTILFMVPLYLWQMHHTASNSELTLALESDLRELGGHGGLQGQVQCFDVAQGCLNALYHLSLVENIPFTGDLMFFAKHDNAVVDHFHDIYWKNEEENPPQVLVIGNEYFGEPDGFGKVHFYPKFDQFLSHDFTQVIARDFPMEGVAVPKNRVPDDAAPAYRIYVRNGSRWLASRSAAGESGR